MFRSIHTTTQFICYMYVSRSLTSMNMVTLVSWQKKIYPNTLTVKPRPSSTTISISGIKMGFSMFFNTSLSESTVQVQALQSLRPLTHSHNSVRSLYLAVFGGSTYFKTIVRQGRGTGLLLSWLLHGMLTELWKGIKSWLFPCRFLCITCSRQPNKHYFAKT